MTWYGVIFARAALALIIGLLIFAGANALDEGFAKPRSQNVGYVTIRFPDAPRCTEYPTYVTCTYAADAMPATGPCTQGVLIVWNRPKGQRIRVVPCAR